MKLDLLHQKQRQKRHGKHAFRYKKLFYVITAFSSGAEIANVNIIFASFD